MSKKRKKKTPPPPKKPPFLTMSGSIKVHIEENPLGIFSRMWNYITGLWLKGTSNVE